MFILTLNSNNSCIVLQGATGTLIVPLSSREKNDSSPLFFSEMGL